jgi:hypothetical protein
MKNKKTEMNTRVAQTAPRDFFSQQVFPLYTPDCIIMKNVRRAVPIIDACVQKLVRLSGGFELSCENKKAQKMLRQFAKTVKVGASEGLNTFVERYLDSLITYGNAVGEIILDTSKTNVVGLYNAPLESIEVKSEPDRAVPTVFVRGENGALITPKMPSLIMFTPLNTAPGEVKGNSLISGLEFYAGVLSEIFKSIGQNFSRAGNLRYAVTYNPPPEMAGANTTEVMKNIATEWADGMNSQKSGVVKDFVALGDVSVKVIGEGVNMPDVQVPVRAICEQIVAKLSIPPFMLGLSWSSTERMSTQQADILTSELCAYRRYVEPVIRQIANVYLSTIGCDDEVEIVWDDINLQDEVELARAELYRAQAKNLLKGE